MHFDFLFFHHVLILNFPINKQETINGFKCALNVLTDPATDPKFMKDLVGNFLDFIQLDLDKRDDNASFIKFVVVSVQKIP